MPTPIVGPEPPSSARDLARHPASRESTAPVGSREWTELLGSGGGEERSRPRGEPGKEIVVVRENGRQRVGGHAYDAVTPDFHLQFDRSEIHYWASHYNYASDTEMIEVVGPRVRERGSYDRADFLTLIEWKAKRVLSRATALNTADAIEDVTRVALSTPTEALRIMAPQALAFVGWPIASVILHFGHADRYPILDFRALESFGVAQPAAYTMPFWLAYVDVTRRIAAEEGVTMRTLDQALWAWSRHHEEMVRGSSGGDQPAA